MKMLSLSLPTLVAWTSFASATASADCDKSAGIILAKHLQPAIEAVDCSLLKQPTLTHSGHKLVGVCYQFFGQISRLTLDAHLSCQAKGENMISKLFGAENAPGLAENVVVDAEIGENCQLYNVKVQASGSLGKLLSDSFGESGLARRALEEGFGEVCRRQ